MMHRHIYRQNMLPHKLKINKTSKIMRLVMMIKEKGTSG